MCAGFGEEDEEDEIRNGCGQLRGLDKRCGNGKIFTQDAVLISVVLYLLLASGGFPSTTSPGLVPTPK
jgi:hypothetical protein